MDYDWTEVPHAEDFAEELAGLIEEYQLRGLTGKAIAAILTEHAESVYEEI